MIEKIMKLKKIIGFIFLLLLSYSCKSISTQKNITQAKWHQIGHVNDVDLYIDTSSIKHMDNLVYSTEKKVFLTSTSKKEYIDRIRSEYDKMGQVEKADKWADFEYTIYHCIYDCTNARFYVTEVEDYDSNGKLIVKTKPSKKAAIHWINVTRDTLGDHTLFFVCDYNQ